MYLFQIHIGEIQKEVCRRGLASLHGISEKRIRRISLLKTQFKSPKDMRGKHLIRPQKISDEIYLKIDEHIKSFHYEVHHYGNTNRLKRRFLSSNLSVLKMYKLFIQKYYPNVFCDIDENTDLKKLNCEVHYETYLRYFNNNFNYRFGRPRSDVCNQCEELKAEISNEDDVNLKKILQNTLKVHEVKAASFYTKLKEAQAEANDELDTLCFDFKQNLPLPHLSTTDVFYSRQLWVYLMCVHSAKNKKSVMYMWPENVARKGSNEVISILYHYIKTFIPESVKKLKIFSDGCRGQNQNYNMLNFWQSLVYKCRFTEIDHYFPFRGHSFLPCDRHFGLLERKQRKVEKVECFDEWVDLVSERFKVVIVDCTMIKKFSDCFSRYYKKTVVSNGIKLQLTKYKWFQFRCNKLNAYTTLTGLVCDTFVMLKPNVLPHVLHFPDENLYDGPIKITSEKKNDILKLVKYLSNPKAIAFYNNLQSAAEEATYESDGSDIE